MVKRCSSTEERPDKAKVHVTMLLKTAFYIGQEDIRKSTRKQCKPGDRTLLIMIRPPWYAGNDGMCRKSIQLSDNDELLPCVCQIMP